MRNDKDNLIVNLSVEFALAVIEYCEMLEANRKFVIANQLLKSGTSLLAPMFERHRTPKVKQISFTK